jgi:hypothetical protein
MGLILRSVERMLKMQFSMARKFTLPAILAAISGCGSRYTATTPRTACTLAWPSVWQTAINEHWAMHLVVSVSAKKGKQFHACVPLNTRTERLSTDKSMLKSSKATSGRERCKNNWAQKHSTVHASLTRIKIN